MAGQALRVLDGRKKTVAEARPAHEAATPAPCWSPACQGARLAAHVAFFIIVGITMCATHVLRAFLSRSARPRSLKRKPGAAWRASSQQGRLASRDNGIRGRQRGHQRGRHICRHICIWRRIWRHICIWCRNWRCIWCRNWRCTWRRVWCRAWPRTRHWNVRAQLLITRARRRTPWRLRAPRLCALSGPFGLLDRALKKNYNTAALPRCGAVTSLCRRSPGKQSFVLVNSQLTPALVMHMTYSNRLVWPPFTPTA